MNRLNRYERLQFQFVATKHQAYELTWNFDTLDYELLSSKTAKLRGLALVCLGIPLKPTTPT